MTVQHKDIPEAQLHEPKGVSTAGLAKVYVANGAGSGTWDYPLPEGAATATAGQQLTSDGAGDIVWLKHPYGMCYFENIATPSVMTYPATYTKLDAASTTPDIVTTASGLGYLVTEGVNARLTYIGPGEVMDVTLTISLSQSVGADRDIRVAVYKNGTKVNGSVAIVTTNTTQKRNLVCSAVVSLATNDYIECYIQNDGASGDITIYTFALFMDPH